MFIIIECIFYVTLVGSIIMEYPSKTKKNPYIACIYYEKKFEQSD